MLFDNPQKISAAYTIIWVEFSSLFLELKELFSIMEHLCFLYDSSYGVQNMIS